MFFRILLIMVCATPLFAAGNAEWILENSIGADISEDDNTFYQSDFGSAYRGNDYADSGKALPLLMSAILPGAGEVYTGHRRGWAMIVLDVASWMKMSSYNSDGDKFQDEYLAYADEHWSEDRLFASCNTNDVSDLGSYGFYDEDNLCNAFYGATMTDEDGEWVPTLSLWVSRADDEREYYENLGKWDQFVFGWDDFSENYFLHYGFEDTDDTSVLHGGEVSPHREFYRSLRRQSNDAYANADKLFTMNMLARVFSVIQTAYLNGMIFNGNSDGFAVAGHNVNLVAQSQGVYGSKIGVSLSY